MRLPNAETVGHEGGAAPSARQEASPPSSRALIRIVNPPPRGIRRSTPPPAGSKIADRSDRPPRLVGIYEKIEACGPLPGYDRSVTGKTLLTENRAAQQLHDDLVEERKPRQTFRNRRKKDGP